jgi:hypothetical protein
MPNCQCKQCVQNITSTGGKSLELDVSQSGTKRQGSIRAFLERSEFESWFFVPATDQIERPFRL